MFELFLYHLQLCLPLFLLVILGWGLIVGKLFDQSVTRVLSGFTFRFLMPALLFSLMSKLSEMPPVDWRVLIAFFGSCVIIYCLGRTAGRFFGLENTGKTIFGMAAIFGNNVQLGVPILKVSLGDEAMPTISLLIIFSVLLLWTTAIASVELGKAEGKLDWKRIGRPMLKVFKNPVVLAIILGSAWGLTGWKLPDFVELTLGYVSSATTPIALIVVGMGLAQHRFTSALPRGLTISTLKIVIHPIIVFCLAKLIGLDEITTNACVLTASLPVAINVYLMASEFRSEEGSASNAIFVSTMLSALLIPLTLTLLGVSL